jgi:hypothetical protein
LISQTKALQDFFLAHNLDGLATALQPLCFGQRG